MCRQSSWRFLQSLLRFIGVAFLLTMTLTVQQVILTVRASAQTCTPSTGPHPPGGIRTLTSALVPSPNPSVLGQTVNFTATATCASCHTNPNVTHNISMNVQLLFGGAS